MLRSVLPRALTVSIAVAAVAVGALTAAAPANAVNPNNLIVFYDTVGTTHLQRSNADVALGKSLITANLRPTGAFTADLPLPKAHARLTAFGYLPVTADVSFVQVGPATGTLSTTADGRSAVNTTARYVVQLTNVFVGGQAAKVGPFCQTVKPVTLTLATPDDGPGFNITTGGTITGTYAIGQFKNCSTSTDLTNIIVPGEGNTVSVTMSNGRITTPGSPSAVAHAAAVARAGS